MLLIIGTLLGSLFQGRGRDVRFWRRRVPVTRLIGENKIWDESYGKGGRTSPGPRSAQRRFGSQPMNRFWPSPYKLLRRLTLPLAIERKPVRGLRSPAERQLGT